MKLNQHNAHDVMVDAWLELAGGEPPHILNYLAQAVAAAFASDNELAQLREVIQFNRDQHAEEVAGIKNAHLSEVLMLLRHIDGTATESDDVRLRWTRLVAAATPVPADTNTEQDTHP